MIDVKIIKKPKATTTNGVSGAITRQTEQADKALHAVLADNAVYADKAGRAETSKNASNADHAAEATHAESAHDIDNDSPAYGRFLRKDAADTASGKIVFAAGLETGTFVEGSSGAAVKTDGSSEVKSLKARQKVETPLVEATTKVQSPLIKGTTKVNTPLVEATTKVNTPLVEATTKVQTPRAEATEVITTSVKTPQFSDDPLAGYGFGIYNETEGQDTVAKAVVDYLTVRRKMVVATLEIWEYRSINGGLVLSPANGVIESVDAGDAAATVYKIYLKERNMFVAGDLIRCQRWDFDNHPTDPIRYYWVRVDYSNVNDCYIEVVKSDFPTGIIPQADDVLVLMGNTSDTARQGFVVIVDDGMSVYSGVNSTSLTGKLKSKFGNLNNMTWHGRSLSGYGLLGDSVYLSGKFLLENTEGGTTTYVDIDSELGTITSSVSKVTNTLQTGGVNLARQTNLGVDGWGYYAKKSDNTVVSSNVTISAIGEGVAFSMWDSSFALGQQYFQFGAPFAKTIENGKMYTVSAEVFINSAEGNKDFSTRLLVGATTAYPRTGTSSNTQTISGTSGWQQVSFLIEADYSSQSTDKALFVRFNNLGQNSLVYFAIRNLKVEEGEVATTYTKAPEDTSDEFTEVRSEITQTAESITMSVVGSLVNNEEDTLYTNAVPPFTLNSSTRIFGGGNLFTIADYLPAGYYTIIMRANFGTAWTGFSLAVERFAYTSFTLATEEKGTVTTIKRTFFFEGLDSPSFKRVYIRMDGANVGDTNADADLQGVWLYAGDGVVGSLVRTGIDIDTGVITLQSNKVYFKNNAGDTPSILFDTTDGKILSKYIKAEELDTNHLIARDTNDFVIATVNADYDSNTGKWLPTNDGAYRIYYQSTNNTQNTAKKLEIKDVTTNNYTTTMRMFDTNGDILWELGTDAMTAGFTNPYYEFVNIADDVDNDTDAEVVAVLPSSRYQFDETHGTLKVAATGNSADTTVPYYEAEFTGRKTGESGELPPIQGYTRYYRRKWSYNSTSSKWEVSKISWDVQVERT